MFFDLKSIIISGIAAGLVIGVLSVAGCCCWIFDIILMLGAGALTVYLSKGGLVEQNELLANGAAAGLVSGLVGGILYLIITLVIDTLAPTLISSLYSNYGSSYGTAISSVLVQGAVGLVCCLPAMILAGIVFGAIGAYAYRSLK